ncbi:unnamed protein product [Cylindrotheca closterium]|uniref:Uncharacterized protein n=1 Tax=Cylindrotheca closterium TaxID=2856 RepID=A0AAD2FWM0_9STRA|nr:unnamed protein product [Cylindrotheca closterium]
MGSRKSNSHPLIQNKQHHQRNMTNAIMNTSMVCLILLAFSCVAFADVSPFYKVNTNVKGQESNERRLRDIHGSQEQDSIRASILNARRLQAIHVPGGRAVVVTSKGKPHLGEMGKGKGGFKYKDRSTSSSSSSKKSSKSSKKGKGGKGKGGKGKGGVIHNPIPTHPVPTGTHPVTAPPLTSPTMAPTMAPVDAISGDIPNEVISGDTPNDVISGDIPNNVISGDTPNDAISGDTPNDAISGDTPNAAISGDTPNDAISGDTPNDAISGDDPVNGDPVSGDDVSGDTGSSGQLVLNFIMESTEVNSLDDQANFQLTTTLTLNGDLFDLIEEDDGTFSRGSANLGDFRGVCTITGVEHYLCSYELYFRTRGSVGAGGMAIKGPVSAAESVAVVTGTSFDYSIYDTGSVTLFQDPNNRWLIARTELFLQNS